jgi:hypothetical protein
MHAYCARRLPVFTRRFEEKNRAVHSAFKFEAPEWANTVAPEDAEEALRRAEDLAQAYYPLGVQTGVHSMIEWCGVMSEYAKMLRYAADTHGMDPRDVDIHHGIPVDIPDYMVEYLAEKLGCQFTPFIKAAPEEWRKAIDKWFH